MQIIRNRKIHITEEIELPDQERIRTLKETETYKNLNILQADTIKKGVEKKKKDLRRTRNFTAGI